MKNRILAIMNHHHLSRKEFAEKTGISAASLSQILNGKQMATMKTVEAIYNAFPEIPLGWIMFGKGEMLAADQDSAQTNPQGIGGVQAEGVQRPEEKYVQPSLFPAEDKRRTNDFLSTNPHQADVKKSDIPRRYITEIRVFYSDGTYESFSGNKQ